MGVRQDITGEVFNGLSITSYSHTKNRKAYWSAVCSCGRPRTIRSDVAKAHNGSCTCPPTKGEVVGKFTYIQRDRIVLRKSYCTVTCDCGRVVTVREDRFKDNTDGCSYHINSSAIKEDAIHIDVSTPKCPNTYMIVDKEDYHLVRDIHWWCVLEHNTYYAQGTVDGKQVRAHRVILGLLEDISIIVDHQDHNGLNNTKANLVSTDSYGNAKNMLLHKSNTSGTCGVHLAKGKWKAVIEVNKNRIALGVYDDIEDAIIARKQAEVRYGFHENHGRDRK